ncbi:MAG: hypothetical protein ACYDDF_02175 [Thermoplasmatota archaeon]
MAKKREERREEQAEAEGNYEFPMPKFDEQAFMRREVQLARITFLAAALGLAVGILARLCAHYLGDWRIGFIPILAGVAVFRPLIQRIGFSADVTTFKALFGSMSLVFFTGLALWVLLTNAPFNAYI